MFLNCGIPLGDDGADFLVSRREAFGRDGGKAGNPSLRVGNRQVDLGLRNSQPVLHELQYELGFFGPGGVRVSHKIEEDRVIARELQGITKLREETGIHEPERILILRLGCCLPSPCPISAILPDNRNPD